MVHVLRIGGKGRVVLPVALRAEAHLEEGDELIAYVEGGRITMETRDDVRRRLRALAAEARTRGDVVEGLLADRRADLALEDERPGTSRGAGG